jgi:DNA polymerase-3 subunit beta
MKFIINRTELLIALSYVSKAVLSKSTNLILEGIYFSVEDNILMLYATDLEMSVYTQVNIQESQNGSIVVPSRILNEIIRKLPAEQISIQTEDDNNIKILSGESQITIHTYSSENYPTLAPVATNGYITIENEKLKRSIKETIFAAASEEQMPVLTGLLMEINEDSFQLTALDGYRMAIRKEDICADTKLSCIIPARVLNEMYKILNIENVKEVYIKYHENKVHFKINNTIIISNLIDGNFIKYKDIIPKNNNLVVKVNPTDLLYACERASLVAREGKNNLLKFHIENNKFNILSRSDIGSADEFIDSEIEGNDIRISFNSKYFIDVLKNISEEKIVMYFIDNLSPCVIKAIDNDKMLHVILPVRYKD